MLCSSHCREFILLICMTTYANHVSHNFPITIPEAQNNSRVRMCGSFNMYSMSGFNIVEGEEQTGKQAFFTACMASLCVQSFWIDQAGMK